jgi:predicted Zn-dependent protease
MRKLNLAFLATLLVVVAVLGGGIHLAHGIMVRRNASALKDWARRAESENQLGKAEQSLAQYLNIRREDGDTWEWYARLVALQDSRHANRERVFLVHEEALRYNAANRGLERRCAELAMELRRYTDARSHLQRLVGSIPGDSQGRAATAELAELQDLQGQCEHGLTKFEDSEERYVQSLKNDPRRVACYNRLAWLRRVDLRRIEAADGTIREMVAKNSDSGLAYIFRWRYNQQFASADAGDIQNGLKLAPDDPQVLLTAAIASESNSDATAAKVYFEKGFKLDPKNLDLALGLARLETQDKHLDRAEAVLREGFQASPSLMLAFYLAGNLIEQGKIEGKDQAGDYIAILRNAGLGETVVRYLDALISFKECLNADDLFEEKKWSAAKKKIEMARALLAGAEPKLVVQLNLMLAEGYRQIGDDEQRLDALQQAADGDRGHDSTRVQLAHELARMGKLDRALRILLPLADRKPEWRLDLARLVFQRAIRQPKDQRNWQEVERYVQQAEIACPQDVEPIVLLRVDVLVAQGRLEDARALLASMEAKASRNLRYRLAAARLSQSQGHSAAALQILDRAEHDLGPSSDLRLARIEYWGREGGAPARAAIAKLAETREQIPPAERAAFLDRLASVELQLGEFNLARRYWREVAALLPKNVGVRVALVELALAAGEQDDAAALLNEIRSAEGDEGVVWQFARAAILVDGIRRGGSTDGKALNEARSLAAEISRRRPRWAHGFALNGQIAELGGSTDPAIESYRRAIELGVVQPWLVRRLVNLLDERKRFDEIERLAELLRDHEAARGEITIVKTLERQYLAQFADYWIDRNRLDEVDRSLAELKRAEPQGLLGLELEARLLDARKRKAELLALLSARGRESPDQIGAVADLLDRYGFTQRAEEAYRVFVARDTRQPERTLALARFLARQDRVSEALEIFNKAWSTCRPEQVATAALSLYDASTVNDAQRQQVAAWAAEAVEKRPDELLLAGKLGVIRVRQGRLDEAEAIFRRLLSRNPANTEALNNLAWLLAMRDRTKAAEAIALVDRAIAISGEDPVLADTRAVARIQLGQLDRAMTDLLAVRRRAPANPSFALHLAWAYHARGQSEQARRELREAEKLGLRARALDPLELGILERLRKM